MNQAIDHYERTGIVVGRFAIDHARKLHLTYHQTEIFYTLMANEQLTELIDLIHNQDYSWRFIDEQRRWDEGYRTEQKIKDLLQDFLWDDIEPYIKEEWRREEVKKLY